VKIYTRTGDGGETALFDGRRVPKSDLRVDAYGEIDELNATIGLVLTEALDDDIASVLGAIQRDLFAVGSRLADPSHRISERVEKAMVVTADVSRLESAIDRLQGELPPLRRFILPGGTHVGALLHVARTICRRAERRIVQMAADGPDKELIAYVNRLSDLLFVMARVVNHRAGAPEIEW
jgi:cob(I)alamin adenosyltransferase